MESMGEVSSKELLDAQSHLWNHIFGFTNTFSLKCALELGIPDAVHSHGKPITLSELAAVLSIPAVRIPNFQRFMRLLVHSEFFTRTSSSDSGEDVYALTTFSAPLIKEKGACITPYMELAPCEFHLEAWQSLSAWFKTEEPSTAFEMAHGSHLWEATCKFPKYGKLVREGLESDSGLISRIIIKESGELFGGVKSLVEVGGGTGKIMAAIKEAFPSIKCGVLDLAHVIDAAEKSTEVEYVVGDMFERIPPADALLLEWVLLAWNDEECVKILKRCKEAIPTKEKGGKVIIIEKVMEAGWEDHKQIQTQLYYDAYVNVLFTGRLRTEPEWKKIFTEAGFKEYKIIPALGLRAIIEIYY